MSITPIAGKPAEPMKPSYSKRYIKGPNALALPIKPEMPVVVINPIENLGARVQLVESSNGSDGSARWDPKRARIDAIRAKIEEKDARAKVVKEGKWLLGKLNDPKSELKKGIKFLKVILPKNIREHSFFKKQLENNSLLDFGDTYVDALQCGFDGLGLIYRYRILNAVEKMFQSYQAEYDKKELPADLLEWQKRIKEEKRELPQSIFEFTLKGVKNAISLAELFVKKVPWRNLDLFLKNWCAPLSTFISFTLRGMKFYSLHKSHDQFNKWSKNFKSWQAYEHPKGSVVNNEQFELIKHVKDSDIKKIITDFKKFGIRLPQAITKPKLLEILQLAPRQVRQAKAPGQKKNKQDWKEQIFADYKKYRDKILALAPAENTAQNLLEKRRLSVQQAIKKMLPKYEDPDGKLVSDIQDLKKPQFEEIFDDLLQCAAFGKKGEEQEKKLRHQILTLGLELPPGIYTMEEICLYLNQVKGNRVEYEILFKQWFFSHPSETLITFYVEHNRAKVAPAKYLLEQMVDLKIDMENKFVQFKYQRSRVSFLIGTTSILMGIAVFGLGTIPTLMFFKAVLQFFSGVVPFSLMMTGYMMHLRYRSITFFEEVKLAYYEFRIGIITLSHLTKQQELLRLEGLIRDLNDPAFRSRNKAKVVAINKDYQVASSEYQASLSKMEKWQESTKKVSRILRQKPWKDFLSYSGLSFDTIRAKLIPGTQSVNKTFNPLTALLASFEDCDISVLDAPTKKFFETYLGGDLQTLQNEIRDDPDKAKKIFQNFFTLSGSKLSKFMKPKRILRRNHALDTDMPPVAA